MTQRGDWRHFLDTLNIFLESREINRLILYFSSTKKQDSEYYILHEFSVKFDRGKTRTISVKLLIVLEQAGTTQKGREITRQALTDFLPQLLLCYIQVNNT